MNADDICAELAAARAYITRGDYQAALDAIDQSVKLWSAERDYWAHVELEAAKVPQPTRPDPGLSEAWLTGKSDVRNPSEQPVVWAKRHESIHREEGDWREHGIS